MNKMEQWRGWVEEVKAKLLASITPEQEEKWKKAYDIQFTDFGFPTCQQKNCPTKRRHWHFADEPR